MKIVFFGLVMALGLVWLMFREELEKEQTKFDSSYIFPYNPARPFILPSLHYGKDDTLTLKPWNVKERVIVEYPVLYAGPYKDSIYAYHDPDGRYSVLGQKVYDYENYPFFKNISGGDSYSGPITFNCSVVVDTSTTFKHGPYSGISGENYQSHPVYIINTYVYALVIEDKIGGFRMTLEAQDKNNIWKNIEDMPISCGLRGNNQVVLLPGDIGVTIVPVFEGPFKTKMRLKVLNDGPEPRAVYSNEFEGHIHLSQFKENY